MPAGIGVQRQKVFPNNLQDERARWRAPKCARLSPTLYTATRAVMVPSDQTLERRVVPEVIPYSICRNRTPQGKTWSHVVTDEAPKKASPSRVSLLFHAGRSFFHPLGWDCGWKGGGSRYSIWAPRRILSALKT